MRLPHLTPRQPIIDPENSSALEPDRPSNSMPGGLLSTSNNNILNYSSHLTPATSATNGGRDSLDVLEDSGAGPSSATDAESYTSARQESAAIHERILHAAELRNRGATASTLHIDTQDNSGNTHDTSSSASSWSSLSRTHSDRTVSSSSSDARIEEVNDDGAESDDPPPEIPVDPESRETQNGVPPVRRVEAVPAPVPVAPPLALEQVNDEPQCRICLAGAEESDELGPLIRPCRCTGTISFVHVQCLNSWRTRSTSRSAFWQCPQCHFKYAFVRTRAFGLAESKLALGSMTLALFTVLVFIASALVSVLFPDILYPELAAERLASRAYDEPSYGYISSSFGFGFGIGGWNFMTYDLTMLPEVVADFVRLAAATFLDIDVDVGKLLGVGQNSPLPPQRKTRGVRYTSGRGPGAKRLKTDTQGNVLSDRLGRGKSWLGRLVARFMLGLSTLGIVSFLQLAMSMSLFAPLQIARGAWFRRRRRDEGGGVEGAAAIMIAAFVLVGVVRAMHQVYKMTVWLARQLLTRAETAILDVDGNPHYARPRAPNAADEGAVAGAAVPQEDLNMREQVTRWLAERAVALDPRRLLGFEGQA